jgi:hypothetical protein
MIALVVAPMSTHAVSVWLLLANVIANFGWTIRSINKREAFVRLFEDAVFHSLTWLADRSALHDEGAWASVDSQL